LRTQYHPSLVAPGRFLDDEIVIERLCMHNAIFLICERTLYSRSIFSLSLQMRTDPAIISVQYFCFDRWYPTLYAEQNILRGNQYFSLFFLIIIISVLRLNCGYLISFFVELIPCFVSILTIELLNQLKSQLLQ